MVSSAIKHTAKGQLKGGVWKAFVTILTFFLIVLFIRLLEAITRYAFSIRATLNLRPENVILTVIWLVFTMILIWPLWIGCTKYFLSVAAIGKGSLRFLFDFFSTFKQIAFIVVVNTFVTVRLILMLTLTLLPGILVLSAAQFYPNNITAVIVTQFTGVLLLSLSIGFIVKAFLNMFLVPYLLVINAAHTPFKIMKQSVQLMRGNRLRVLFLIASFTGWLFLCLFIVPIFYVFPYFNTALATLAEDIIMKSTKKELYKADKYATIEF